MIKYICNVCGAEIPKVKKRNPLTGEEFCVVDIGRIKLNELDVSKVQLFDADTHICKTCAEMLSAKIDYNLLQLKMKYAPDRKRRNRRT